MQCDKWKQPDVDGLREELELIFTNSIHQTETKKLKNEKKSNKHIDKNDDKNNDKKEGVSYTQFVDSKFDQRVYYAPVEVFEAGSSIRDLHHELEIKMSIQKSIVDTGGISSTGGNILARIVS